MFIDFNKLSNGNMVKFWALNKMAFVTDQIKTEQTDPFICSMCKIRGKTEDAIKNHILQVHLSEHFAEVDTTAGIQNSLSQIFKECSDQKMIQNGDQVRQLSKS